MSDETTTKSTSFRPWGKQEAAVRVLCEQAPGPVRPNYADMMRHVIDAGLLAIHRKAERAKKAKR